MKAYGSRAEVFHGTAEKTGPQGLSKKNLIMGKDGEIKSRRKSQLMKKRTKQGTNPLTPFIQEAIKRSKSRKSGFGKVPKKGTKAYKKIAE